MYELIDQLEAEHLLAPSSLHCLLEHHTDTKLSEYLFTKAKNILVTPFIHVGLLNLLITVEMTATIVAFAEVIKKLTAIGLLKKIFFPAVMQVMT